MDYRLFNGSDWEWSWETAGPDDVLRQSGDFDRQRKFHETELIVPDADPWGNGSAGTPWYGAVDCANGTLNVTAGWLWPCAEAWNETWGNETLVRTVPPMPWWQKLAWSVFFAAMVCVATGGNLIVIWIVLTHKRMRSVTNYFLVNLSIADTMVSTLNVIFNLVVMISGDWPFGEAYCKISNFVAVLSVAASVFTMMAISIDRYIAIMSPLRPRMSKMTTLNIAFVIWLFSSVLSFPNLLYSTIFVQNLADGQHRSICFLQWPDGDTMSSYQEFVYNVLILVLTYILPISAMVYTYARIGHELWGSQSIGECTAKQVESVQNKRRVVKMMIVVVLIFAFCWLPYHLYFIAVYCDQSINQYPHIQNIYLFIYWLAMSNSMYNPIIYCWMNSRFRHGFKKVFRWCPGIHFVESATCERANTGVDHHNPRYSCSRSPDLTSRVERDGVVHISLHTLTDVVCMDNNGQATNCLRHQSLRGPGSLLRKLSRERKTSAAV